MLGESMDTTTTTIANNATHPVLSYSQDVVFLSFVVGGALLAGIIVLIGRGRFWGSKTTPDPSESVIRSWLAISLVFGLLVLCTAAFVVNDEQLRSTLLGGLIASVSAAVTFYFSSKATDQAVSAVVNLSQGNVQSVTSAPPQGTVGQVYSYQFSANGLKSAIFHFEPGPSKSLPKGLKLDPNGNLHGTPTASGSFSFRVNARTADGTLLSQPVTIVINNKS
jgi:hypothetical protein